MAMLPMADQVMALHQEVLAIGSFAVEADAFHSTRILLGEVDLINSNNSEEIQHAATKVKDAIAVDLPHETQDHATALVTSMMIAGKGGQTGGQIHIAVIWQSGVAATDIDLHMVCPECDAHVCSASMQCHCSAQDATRRKSLTSREDTLAKLDLYHQGYNDISVKNMDVDTASTRNPYQIKVQLSSGSPVAYRVQIDSYGALQRNYIMPPHLDVGEMQTICVIDPHPRDLGKLIVTDNLGDGMVASHPSTTSRTSVAYRAQLSIA